MNKDIVYMYAFFVGTLTRIICEDLDFWVFIGVYVGCYLGFYMGFNLLEKMWNWKPEQRSLKDYEDKK